MSYFACIALVVLMLNAGMSLGAANPYRKYVAESPKYAISLVKVGKPILPYYSPQFEFDVVEKKTKQRHRAQVNNPMTDLKEIHVVNNNVVIIGKVGNTGDIVSVLPLPNGQAKAKYFLCYGPQMSPSKRFVIFRKFYPRFADPPATSDVLLIYDAQHDSLTKQDVGASGDALGTVVYPQENAAKQSVQSWIEDPQQRHAIISSAGYLWLNETRVVFVDVIGDTHWLVDIDVKDRPRPVIRQSVLQTPGDSPITGLAAVPGGVKITAGQVSWIVNTVAR